MSQNAEYGMVMPFWIDTDAYSDRDRQMFVCGVEFAEIYAALSSESGPLMKTIHSENESRVRMMCGRVGRLCKITPTVCEGWSTLVVERLAQ